MTFIDAAVLILKAEGKPLTWRKLAELAVRHDLLTHVGTDPAETMHVRLAESVRRHGERSPFQDGKGGTYALREWRGGSPGPMAAAAAELAARATKAPSAAPAVVPAAASSAASPAASAATAGRGGRRAAKVEPSASGSGRRRGGGRRGAAGAAAGGTEKVAATVELPAAASAPGPESVVAAPSAVVEGAGPVVEGAARPSEGRKRRRRSRRGKGGGTAVVEAGASAAPVERASAGASSTPAVSRPAPSSAVASPRPAPSSGAASPVPAPSVPVASAQPAPTGGSGSGGGGASCDLGRVAETALRWLRGGSGRRPLRVAELLAQWSGRGMPEGRLPAAAVTAALAAADAGVRVGSSLVGVSSGRWAPTEWAWGEEVAVLERRVGEAVAQHQAALRRTVLRRLAELPLPAFQQLVVALLAAEGFRELRAMDEPAGAPDALLLRGRMPYGPAEIAMVVLVVRAAPGRFIGEDQAAVLRGRLSRTGACGGAIYTTGRVSDAARRDLVPPNAIPLLAVEHEALVDRLLAHRIGIRVRTLELPVLDPDVYGTLPEPERG